MDKPLITFEPSQTYDQAIIRAAAGWGIEPEYFDIWGKRHVTSITAQKAILESIGVPVGSQEEADGAVVERLWKDWTRLLPEVSVVALGTDSAGLSVRVPADLLPATLKLAYRWESGERRIAEYAVAAMPTIGGAEVWRKVFLCKRIPLPAEAGLGYHEVEATLESASGPTLRGACRLILCPARAYLTPALAEGKRTAGIAVSLYSLRSARDWGCGDFTDLARLVDWASEELGAGFVALNPLHAIHNRQPYNTSPYLPNCTYYRNPIYLDVEKVRGFAGSARAEELLAAPGIQAEIDALRGSELVEYERVCALKLRMLKLAFVEFLGDYRRDAPEARPFRTFVEGEGELLDRYAVYCALDEWIHRHRPEVWTWPDWPEEYRDPESPATREFALRHPVRVLFYKFLQWQIDVQLSQVQRQAKDRGMVIGLYHDLALATDRCGSDLWAYRDFYVAGCRVGAPPDDFSPEGQDWSFPPPNSEHHQRTGYRLFIQAIRNNARHGGALRIDHVMRFFRLYWIPDGATAKQGAYVRDFHEHLLGILALESVRNKFIVIGEDLGTVAPEMRKALERFGIFSYRLLYFEKGKSGEFRLPNEYPQQALVSVTTHDLPTLAGFWQGLDIEARRKAGLLADERSGKTQLAERSRDKQRLLDALFRLGLLPDWFPRQASSVPDLAGELHNAVIGFLVSAPSLLLVLNQEDLFKQVEQQNLPGSTWQYPNWRRKMKFSLEELLVHHFARDCTAMFRDWLRKTGRSSPCR